MSASIESVLQETRVFPPPPGLAKNANISGMAAYEALRAEAERDFEGFWGRLARETLLWSKPFTKVLDESNAPFFKWFYDGELNASYNCLDRHLKTQPDKVAIIFEADDGKVTKVTYKDLHARVCRFANALKARGIQKGDRVLIYLPMSIEAIVAMQACARIEERARAHRRRRCGRHHHRRRPDARRQGDPAQARGGRGHGDGRHGQGQDRDRL
jgi:acetyl-CoA synthetase